MRNEHKLSIDLLGQIRVASGPRIIGPLPKKSQALLAYLACQSSEPTSRERLATLLWGYSDAEHARASLRQAFATIRAVLGSAHDIVIVDAECARLAATDALRIDVRLFEELARSAAQADLDRASALYRGEFLAGLQITSEPFEEWLRVERARLLQMASKVQRRLATTRIASGDVDGAIEAGQRLTHLDPLCEDGHRLLIRLFGGAGRRSAALAQFALLAEALRRDLGVTPERETIELVEAIRRGEQPRTAGSSGPNSLTATALLPAKPVADIAPVRQLANPPPRVDDRGAVLHDLPFQLERKRVGFTVDPAAADAPARVAEFFDACGLAWGTDPNVTRRIAFGVSQAIETIREHCEPSGPLLIEARCDDFDVDVRMTYHGGMLELPEQRPSDAEIIEAGDQHLAGYLLRRNADRIRTALKGSSVILKFHFER